MHINKKEKISPKEELFCQYYSKSGQAFGNARLAYSLAFGKAFLTDAQKSVCDTLSQRLFRKVLIYKRCDDLMKETIDDATADSELEYVIKQRENLHAKVSAISERNKVRGRIIQKHKFEGVSDEALAERAAEIIAGVIGDKSGGGDEEKGE